MSLHIVTLAEMKAELEITDTDNDDVLTDWMEGLQGRFDDQCNRVFLYEAARIEYFDGGERWLLVCAWPIATVTEIIIDQDQNWNASDALDSTEYGVNYKRGRITYGLAGSYAWPVGHQNIRLTYAGGFVSDEGAVGSSYVSAQELDRLRRAMFMQAGFEWRNRKTLGVTQISQSGAAKQVGAGVALALKGMTLMPEVIQTLQRFARV